MARLMQEGVPPGVGAPADIIRRLLAAGDASSRSKAIDDCRPEILASCSVALAADARFTAQRALLGGVCG
jgi:hypothetical protein